MVVSGWEATEQDSTVLFMCRPYTLNVMSEGKTRVDFNAPTPLVERADTVADLLDISRTSLLIDALRDELDDLVADEGFQRRLKAAYYTERIGFETVESILGTEEAIRMKLLRDSLDREPPKPQAEDAEQPTRAEFYTGSVPEWTPGDEGGNTDEADPGSRG